MFKFFIVVVSLIQPCYGMYSLGSKFRPYSTLTESLQNYDVHAFKVLFAKGDLKSPDAIEAFRHACMDNLVEAITVFLKAGMDPNLIDDAGYSMLSYAVQSNENHQAVTLLLNAGADPSFCGHPCIETPFHVIAKKDFPENHILVELSNVPGINPNVVNREGCTPFHLASLHNNIDVMNQLLVLGGDVGDKASLTEVLKEVISKEQYLSVFVLLCLGEKILPAQWCIAKKFYKQHNNLGHIFLLEENYEAFKEYVQTLGDAGNKNNQILKHLIIIAHGQCLQEYANFAKEILKKISPTTYKEATTASIKYALPRGKTSRCLTLLDDIIFDKNDREDLRTYVILLQSALSNHRQEIIQALLARKELLEPALLLAIELYRIIVIELLLNAGAPTAKAINSVTAMLTKKNIELDFYKKYLQELLVRLTHYKNCALDEPKSDMYFTLLPRDVLMYMLQLYMQTAISSVALQSNDYQRLCEEQGRILAAATPPKSTGTFKHVAKIFWFEG